MSGRGVEPASLTLPAEVVRQCADEYGFSSPFVTEAYSPNRAPVISMQAMETTVPKCQKRCFKRGQIHR